MLVEYDAWNSNCADVMDEYDDIIKWKHFPRNWPFVGESSDHRWIPSQRPVTQGFDIFFDVRLVIWDAMTLIVTSL